MTVYLEVNTNDITSIILQTNMYRDFSHCGFNWAIPFNMCTPPPLLKGLDIQLERRGVRIKFS